MNFNDLLNLIKESHEEFDPDKYSDVIDKGVQGMFATLWGDWIEFNSHNSEFKKEHNVSGEDILEIAPKYSEFLKKPDIELLEKIIYGFINEFEDKNGQKDIFELHEIALKADGQTLEDHYEESDIEHFVWYVLMRIVGSGVSWEDNHESPNFSYPYKELSFMEFSDKSFPEYDADDNDYSDEEDGEEFDEDEDSLWSDDKFTINKEFDDTYIADWEREGEEWKGDDFKPSDSEKWRRMDDED